MSERVMKASGGSEGVLQTFFKLARGGVSGQLHVPIALTRWDEAPWYQSTGCWLGPTAGRKALEKR